MNIIGGVILFDRIIEKVKEKNLKVIFGIPTSTMSVFNVLQI